MSRAKQVGLMLGVGGETISSGPPMLYLWDEGDLPISEEFLRSVHGTVVAGVGANARSLLEVLSECQDAALDGNDGPDVNLCRLYRVQVEFSDEDFVNALGA